MPWLGKNLFRVHKMLDKNLSQWVSRALGSAVIWIWAVTALRLANFLIVLPIALRSIPSDLMGIWYLMLNIIGGISLLEFGMCSAFSRQATFFFASANTQNADGSQINFPAIHGLVRLAHTVYSYLALVTLVACIGGGAWMMSTHPDTMFHPLPLFAYFTLTIAATIKMKGLFWNPLLFGLQQVSKSQRIQFTGIVLSYVVTAGGLLAGGGIVALAAGQCVSFLYPLFRSRQLVMKRFPEILQAEPLTLPWKPIWSSTLQTGLILWGGWVGTQGLILICGQTSTLETSASFSLSFLVVFTVHSLAQSWLVSRYPTMSALWTERRFSALSSLATQRIAFSIGTYLTGAIAAWVLLPYLLHFLGSKTPILPPGQLALAFALGGVDLFISSYSTVLITCNRFLQMPYMLAVGLLTFGAAFILGGAYGVWGILLAPILCQTLTTLWIVPLLFRSLLSSQTQSLEAVS